MGEGGPTAILVEERAAIIGETRGAGRITPRACRGSMVTKGKNG